MGLMIKRGRLWEEENYIVRERKREKINYFHSPLLLRILIHPIPPNPFSTPFSNLEMMQNEIRDFNVA